MTAHIRNLARQFTPTNKTKFKNFLVSGCSFTFNNSDKYICSWPYYLRDLAGFEQVYDCSQSGVGSNHIFNSIINEIETNTDVNTQDTLVVVMWSGLTRTDVIAEQDITKSFHGMSNFKFDNQYATLSLFNGTDGATLIDQLCRQYKKIVSIDAQIYESLLKIIALKAYLDQKGFRSFITSWKDPQLELEKTTINPAIINSALSTLNHIEYLWTYAELKNLKEDDGHPNPNGYLGWTQEHLLPKLKSLGHVTEL